MVASNDIIFERSPADAGAHTSSSPGDRRMGPGLRREAKALWSAFAMSEAALTLLLRCYAALDSSWRDARIWSRWPI